MAKHGRKDSGELYDVFRKITSQKAEGALKDIAVHTPEDGEEGEPAEAEEVKITAPVKIERAFVVSYNTAVIIFIAFIIILIWVYLIGVKRGERRETQTKARVQAQNIKGTEDTDLTSIRTQLETGTEKEQYTVEVLRVSKEKYNIPTLNSKYKEPLEKWKGVNQVDIALSKDGLEYLVWVNTFPHGSSNGDICLEKMKNIDSSKGTKAFPNAKLVPFDKSRVVTK